MSVLSADLHKAVNVIWDTQGLDWVFKVNWDLSDRDEFSSLNDQEAPPGQPFPYCIFQQSTVSSIIRMSGHTTNEKHEVRDIPWSFRVHSRQIVGNDSTAKELAADLIEKISMRFGGHPEVAPKQLTLDNGFVLLVQYQSDFGVETGDEEYSWILNYIIKTDTPVAI